MPGWVNRRCTKKRHGSGTYRVGGLPAGDARGTMRDGFASRKQGVLAVQAVFALWAADDVAQALGAQLGGGAILLREVSTLGAERRQAFLRRAPRARGFRADGGARRV